MPRWTDRCTSHGENGLQGGVMPSPTGSDHMHRPPVNVPLPPPRGGRSLLVHLADSYAEHTLVVFEPEFEGTAAFKVRRVWKMVTWKAWGDGDRVTTSQEWICVSAMQMLSELTLNQKKKITPGMCVRQHCHCKVEWFQPETDNWKDKVSKKKTVKWPACYSYLYCC